MKHALIVAVLFTACAREVPTMRVQSTAFARRVTAEGALKAKESTPITVSQAVRMPMKVLWIAQDGTLLHKGDVVARFDATDFTDELLSGKQDKQATTNRMTKSATDASTTRTNLRRDAKQSQNELESARKFKFDDAEVFSRYQRIEAETDETLAGSRKQHAEEVLSVRDRLAAAERDLLTIEERKAMYRIRNAEDGLKALEILAPHDGILVLVRNWRGEVVRVGSTVWQGNPIAEIPRLDRMEAEIFVLEADAAGLAVGQSATITIDSHPGVLFTGKISQVDKFARPRRRNVPVQYFGVTVALDRNDPQAMKPGARVNATLAVESRDRAFVIPRQALFEKEGKKLVYRRNGKAFEAVDVTVGSSSPGRVVVTRGIIEGDELALRDPAARTETHDQS